MPISAIKNNIRSTTFTAQLAPETLAKLNTSVDSPELEKMLIDKKKRIASFGDRNTVIKLIDNSSSQNSTVGMKRFLNEGIFAEFTNTLAPNLKPVKVKLSDRNLMSVNILNQISKFFIDVGEQKLCKEVLDGNLLKTPADYFTSLAPKKNRTNIFISKILKKVKL